MDCIVCKKPLEDIGAEGSNQPDNGTAFTTSGHYGSTVFDPMDGTYLEINVCDPCLKQSGQEGRVLMGFPRPAPAHGPLVKWPLTEIKPRNL